MRTGLLAKKIGMTARFTDQGRVAVTVLKLDECQVVGHRTVEKNGYDALQIGVGKRKASRASKPLKGQYKKSKLPFKSKVVEFRIAKENFIDVGMSFKPSHFVPGQKVDVAGVSVGKGFQGVIKRHGFSGLRATHGVSISHRSHGSTGQCQDPGKVFKGKKMAGQMGNKSRTLQNLEIFEVLNDKNLILVKGAVPGSKGSYVAIKDAIKKKLPESVPFPGDFEKLASDFSAKKADKKAKTDDDVAPKAASEEVVEEVVKNDVPAEAPAAAKSSEAKSGEAPTNEPKAEEKNDDVKGNKGE